MPDTIVNFDFNRKIYSAKSRTLISISDGDTPTIEQPVRMVSIDTPEKSKGVGWVERSQLKLDKCRKRLLNGFYEDIPEPLRIYLANKLTDDAASQQEVAGIKASNAFNTLLENRLALSNGTKRNLAVIPIGNGIDNFGRLLAYLAPWFKGGQSDPLPPRNDPARRTFNLEMIENGWAAFFPIYPSLPSNNDLNQAIESAVVAWEEKRGQWSGVSGKNFLVGYEFRACIRLGEAKTAEQGITDAFRGSCVDLRNRKIVGKFGYFDIPPPYRLWIWEDEIMSATEALDLLK